MTATVGRLLRVRIFEIAFAMPTTARRKLTLIFKAGKEKEEEEGGSKQVYRVRFLNPQ